MTPREVNESEIYLASASRTASVNGDTKINTHHRGVAVVVDATTVAVAETVTVAIEFFDIASQKWVALLTGAAITTAGVYTYMIYPGAGVVAGTGVAGITKLEPIPLPNRWRVTFTHSSTGAHVYSVGIHALV